MKYLLLFSCLSLGIIIYLLSFYNNPENPVDLKITENFTAELIPDQSNSDSNSEIQSGNVQGSAIDTTMVNLKTLPPFSTLSFDHVQPDIGSLVKKFMDALQRNDTLVMTQLVLSYREYKDSYYYMPEPDLNPNSADFMASVFANGNYKELSKWMSWFQQENLVYSHYEIKKGEEPHKGYSYIKGVTLWGYKKGDTNKNPVEIPIFKTLLKTDKGYKIWSILET